MHDVKVLETKKVVKTVFIKKKALLASGLDGSKIQEYTFLSRNTDKICGRLRLLIQDKRCGNEKQK